jgi:hypothetical protein
MLEQCSGRRRGVACRSDVRQLGRVSLESVVLRVIQGSYIRPARFQRRDGVQAQGADLPLHRCVLLCRLTHLIICLLFQIQATSAFTLLPMCADAHKAEFAQRLGPGQRLRANHQRHPQQLAVGLRYAECWVGGTSQTEYFRMNHTLMRIKNSNGSRSPRQQRWRTYRGVTPRACQA